MIAVPLIAPIKPSSSVHGLELLLTHESIEKHVDSIIQELGDKIARLEEQGSRDGWMEDYPQRNGKRYYYHCWTSGKKRKRKYIKVSSAADVQAEIERGAEVKRLREAIVKLEEWRSTFTDIIT